MFTTLNNTNNAIEMKCLQLLNKFKYCNSQLFLTKKYIYLLKDWLCYNSFNVKGNLQRIQLELSTIYKLNLF